jgi:acyl-CoA synthetase (NDP forming)
VTRSKQEPELSRLSPLFRPEAIAIIGASPKGTPAEVLANLDRIGFPGEIVLVNPGRAEIAGRVCYPSLQASGVGVDLAAICVKAERVPAALTDAVAAGARSAVVFADGFSTGDPRGPELQSELAALALNAGIPVLGPNSMGYLAPAFGSAVYIDRISRMPEAGGIGLVTQSGSVGVAAINHTGTLRLSAMISVGNEAVVTLADAIDFLCQDGSTRVIALFSEGIRDGQNLVRAVRESVARGIPVLICKTGRSPAAMRAAQSHTGAMANDQMVVRAVLQQAGAAVVEDLDELFAAAELLATGRRFGPRLAGITLSGGHVGLLTDLAEANGLNFPQPDASFHHAIETALGAGRSVANPLDCWINDDVVGAVERASAALARWPDVDGFVFAVDTPADPPTSFVGMGRQIAELAVQLAQRDGRPVIMQATCVAADDPWVTERLRAAGVPRLSSLRAALAGWGAITRARSASAIEIPDVIRPSKIHLRPAPEGEIYKMLADLDVETPRYKVCRSPEEAAAAAKAVGFPVVVKVHSLNIAHKTELGGVAVGLSSPAEVVEAAERMLAIPGADGVLVAEMVAAGLEAFVGAKTDAAFGPIMLVGMGGTVAELFGDVAVLSAPTTADAVLSALSDLKIGALLAGYRGAKPFETGRFTALVTALGDAICHADPALSIDLNPVRLVGGRAVVLDAKISVSAG